MPHASWPCWLRPHQPPPRTTSTCPLGELAGPNKTTFRGVRESDGWDEAVGISGRDTARSRGHKAWPGTEFAQRRRMTERELGNAKDPKIKKWEREARKGTGGPRGCRETDCGTGSGTTPPSASQDSTGDGAHRGGERVRKPRTMGKA